MWPRTQDLLMEKACLTWQSTFLILRTTSVISLALPPRPEQHVVRLSATDPEPSLSVQRSSAAPPCRAPRTMHHTHIFQQLTPQESSGNVSKSGNCPRPELQQVSQLPCFCSQWSLLALCPSQAMKTDVTPSYTQSTFLYLRLYCRSIVHLDTFHGHNNRAVAIGSSTEHLLQEQQKPYVCNLTRKLLRF